MAKSYISKNILFVGLLHLIIQHLICILLNAANKYLEIKFVIENDDQFYICTIIQLEIFSCHSDNGFEVPRIEIFIWISNLLLYNLAYVEIV